MRDVFDKSIIDFVTPPTADVPDGSHTMTELAEKSQSDQTKANNAAAASWHNGN